MNSQNCSNRSVRALVYGICALFTLSFTSMVFAQNYFPIGAWCFDPLNDPLLYDVDPVTNEHTLVEPERDRLLNLGLTYFIACQRPEGDNALINLGVELNGAFRATTEYTALNDPAVQPPYEIWRYSYLGYNGIPSDGNNNVTINHPTWRARVDNGYTSIGNFYGDSLQWYSGAVVYRMEYES